jgi:hypothetical protein
MAKRTGGKQSIIGAVGGVLIGAANRVQASNTWLGQIPPIRSHNGLERIKDLCLPTQRCIRCAGS